jgi:hypothetical protein
VFDLK